MTDKKFIVLWNKEKNNQEFDKLTEAAKYTKLLIKEGKADAYFKRLYDPAPKKEKKISEKKSMILYSQMRNIEDFINDVKKGDYTVYSEKDLPDLYRRLAKKKEEIDNSYTLVKGYDPAPKRCEPSINAALERKGIEPDTIDVAALIDSELTCKENEKAILKEVGASKTKSHKDYTQQAEQYYRGQDKLINARPDVRAAAFAQMRADGTLRGYDPKHKTPREEAWAYAKKLGDTPEGVYTRTYLNWFEGQPGNLGYEPDYASMGLGIGDHKEILSHIGGYLRTGAGFTSDSLPNGLSKQKQFEKENKRKAHEGKKLKGQQTLTSAVSTSKRLSEFGLLDPKKKTWLESGKNKYVFLINTTKQRVKVKADTEKEAHEKFHIFYPKITFFEYRLLDPGTLTIKGKRKSMTRLAKHLQKEHPSTKGKIRVNDPSIIGKPKYFICDYCGEKKLIANGMNKKNNHLQCPDCKNVYNFAQFKKESDKKRKALDPKPVKSYTAKFSCGKSCKIPQAWYDAMVLGIKKSSDVRNPYAIVKNIWAKLSSETRQDIIRRAAKGERFNYNLPLPDDRVTKGKGTLRMVKPFKLAEAQVNVSKKDMAAVKKSGIFKPMKREDGSICQVARCKGERPVNIFVDEIS